MHLSACDAGALRTRGGPFADHGRQAVASDVRRQQCRLHACRQSDTSRCKIMNRTLGPLQWLGLSNSLFGARSSVHDEIQFRKWRRVSLRHGRSWKR
jgi:hypothetical protein